MRGGRAHGNAPAGTCFLCHKPGHIARDCPDRGSGGKPGQNKRAFGAGYTDSGGACTEFAYGCCEVACGGQDMREDNTSHEANATSKAWGAAMTQYGILDGGATASCASFEIIQYIADEWEPLGQTPILEDNGGRRFLFAGGESTPSKTLAWMPHQTFPDGIGIHVVPCTETPLLIGLDMIRYYGLVLDYHNDTVYSHGLHRYVPSAVLPSGHLAVYMLPSDEDY
jgi:hypothetical protein